MKTIEEKNRMIAEFMGYDIGIEPICMDDLSDKQEAFCFDNIMTPQQRSSYMRGTKYFDIKNVFALQYHTSWDWLMPVVRSIVADTKVANDKFMDLLEVTPFAIIEDTYEAVVQFIEWYNENK